MPIHFHVIRKQIDLGRRVVKARMNFRDPTRNYDHFTDRRFYTAVVRFLFSCMYVCDLLIYFVCAGKRPHKNTIN